MGMGIGKVRDIRQSGGVLRLDIELHGELLRDVLPLDHGQLRHDWQVGDRVWIDVLDRADADRFAVPIRVATAEAMAAVIVKDGRQVEVRSQSGTPVPLVTKPEYDDFVTWVRDQFKAVGGHTHLAPSGGGTTTTTTVAAGTSATPPEATGTQVLKAE